MATKLSFHTNQALGGVAFAALALLLAFAQSIQPTSAKNATAVTTQTAGVWTTKTSMPTRREHAMSGVINGLLYVAGGFNGTTLAELNVLEVYNPATNSWSTGTSMTTARHGAASAVINGKLYVAGGGLNVNPGQVTNILEVYDPVTNAWATKTSMPTARGVPGFATIDGKLYVVGGGKGSTDSFARTNVLEVYDPATDTWTSKTSMPTARAYPTAEAIDGKLYVVGGDNNNTIYGTFEVYDPATNAWTTKTSMPTPRTSLVSGVIGGRLYAIGGIPTQSGPSETAVNESYDPMTNTWRSEDSMLTARWAAVAEVINDTLYVVGGATGRGQGVPLATNEAFSTRLVRVLANNAAPGSTVTLPVELVSLGDENALGFSLTFDPAILSNPQVTFGLDTATATLNQNVSQTAQGRVGIAIALPATQKFAAGTRQIANVVFTIAPNAPATTTTIGFGDQPIPREVVNDAASALTANYTPGSVTVTPGYEADVAPRPNGNNNGAVTVADWVQVGRFAAGVDTAAVGSEFQRADCSPKETKGDGKIGIADWVQAGRYAAGVDPVVPAGGPTAPVSGLLTTDGFEPSAAEQQTTRAVRAVSANIAPGQNGVIALELDAMGNENALGFSLNFDPAKLRFVSAATGMGATAATLNLNLAQAANGHVGIALALAANQTFASGTRQLIVATFAAASNANGTTTVTIGDLPVGREVVDSAANGLAANWTAATVTLVRTAASVSAASFNGEALAAEAIVVAFGSNLATATQIAATVPLPTSLAGTSVKVKDSAGVERLAALFFVAPAQINYLVPAGTAAGEAVVTITSADGTVSVGKARIANAAPGLFSANASGQGVAAGEVFRVKADGTQSYEPLVRYDATQQRFAAVPIDLGTEDEQVFLILYGTGWRARSSLASVTTKIGGVAAETLYAGPQGFFAGLDQLNVRLPRSLAGRGELEVALIVDGLSANTVTIAIK